jgi:hypothetical protein
MEIKCILLELDKSALGRGRKASEKYIDTFGSMTIHCALICSLSQEFTLFGSNLSSVTGFNRQKMPIWYGVKNTIISLIFFYH